MDILRLAWFLCLAVFALAGCVREEEALTDNQSDPIGGDGTASPPAPPPPPPPPGMAALVIVPPSNQQAEATGPATVVDTGQATATGGDGNYSFANDAPAGGFGLGTTVVMWTVTDGMGTQASSTQDVMVSDTTPPVIGKPADLQVESTGTMTMVDIGVATATDLVDAAPALSNDMPAAGFPMGSTPVTWSASDASGNTATAIQMITVTAPSGGGPLAVTAPANITMEAEATLTNVTLGAAMASGGVAPVTISNDAPAAGFPLGATTVTWTANDAAMAAASATQLVTVNDTTAPSLTVPANVSGSQDSGLGNTMVDIGTASATDAVDANPSISNDAPGNGFPVGDTTVTWTATDASGNSATGTQVVSVSAFQAEQCSALVADFESTIYPLLDNVNNCGTCHTGSNPLPNNNFGMPDSATPEDNFEVFRVMAGLNVGNVPRILSKATGNDHGGGVALMDTEPDYATLAAFVDRASACVVDDGNPMTAEVVLGSGYEQLHKITGVLGSRVPTSDEVNLVNAAGTDQVDIDQALAAIIDGLINEEAFYTRVEEMYNDLLLTDRNAEDRDNPDNNFDLDAFVPDNYFDNWDDDAEEGANYGIAKAPLALVRYVIENDRPFTEIVTADYMMVNPFSATIFSVNPGGGGYPYSPGSNANNYDPDDFRRVNSVTQTDGDQANLPISGVLTTHAFLARYQTTSTNVNRKRARFVFDYFLGVDIEGLAPRDGLDLDNVIGDVPTYEDPQCTVCHDVLDPIAGLFTKRDDRGEYDTGNRYEYTRTRSGVPRMVPAGYSMDPADALPNGDNNLEPLIFLGQRIAADDRFADKTVRVVLKGLTRIDSRSPAVNTFVNDTKARFAGSNYNFKALVKDIVLSDYFRAQNLADTVSPAQYADLGTGRLITPEELRRKILAVTGGAYDWRGPNSNSGLTGRHYLLYGGIDSDEVIARTTSPTSLMDGIQERIANQVACERVADDLYNGGILFPNVDETTVPAGGEAQIRDNIVFLHRHLLGEDLAAQSAEVDATYQVFLDVRALGETSIPSQCRSNNQSNDSNQTVLPWMAVVTYLLSDYRFLHD